MLLPPWEQELSLFVVVDISWSGEYIVSELSVVFDGGWSSRSLLWNRAAQGNEGGGADRRLLRRRTWTIIQMLCGLLCGLLCTDI